MLVIRVDLSSLKRSEVRMIGEMVRGGGVVAMPTDTVYGLCTIMDREESLIRIYKIKGRSGAKPLPVLVDSLEMARSIAKIDPRMERILRDIWPNKISVILQRRASVPDLLTSGTDRVMVRWADSTFVNAVIASVGRPITATSANISGKRPISDGRLLRREFLGRVHKPDMIVDAGRISESNEPSTIIDLAGKRPILVREGAIGKEAVESLANLRLSGVTRKRNPA